MTTIITWHPVTDIPPIWRCLVSIGGEVYEAFYYPQHCGDALYIDGWLLTDFATQRKMLRAGATVTAWAEMPKAP